MKTKHLLAVALVTTLCTLSPARAQTPTIETMAPVVVKTVPQAGVDDVAPGTVEIKVTFSKEMADESWTWSSAWKDSTPEMSGKPRYEADRKTCVIKVKLEPNKTYGYWLNSQKFTGFRDTGGRAAVPYLLAFKTADTKSAHREDVKGYLHTIAAGETLSGIAQAYRQDGRQLTPEQILQANPGLSASRMVVGKTILIPGSAGSASAAN